MLPSVIEALVGDLSPLLSLLLENLIRQHELRKEGVAHIGVGIRNLKDVRLLVVSL